MNVSKFIKPIVCDILKKSLSSKEYCSIGASRNIFRNCCDRNNGVGDTCREALTNLIVLETKYDEIKHNLVLDHIKQFLTTKEIGYLKRNPDDIKMIVNFASEKFSDANKKQFESKFMNGFTTMDIDELIGIGWTLEELVEESIKLDYETINDLTVEHNGDFIQWVNVVRENAATIKFLVTNKNKIVGYWYFVPLFDEYFIKAKNGKLIDSEITVDTIPAMIPGTYNIYFIGICLKEALRRKTITFGRLLFAILDTIEEMANNKIYINEICALSYTSSGEQLCKSIGLKYLRDHVEHGKIYCGKIVDLFNRDFCQGYIDLIERYKNKFNSNGKK